MNLDILKEKKELVSVVLFGVSAVLAVLVGLSQGKKHS